MSAAPSGASPAVPRAALRTRVYDVASHLWGEVLRRHSLTGIVVATLFYVAANTPSLLPRPWWLQGVIAAVSAVLGYAVGNVIGLAARAVIRWMGLRVTMDHRRARLLLGTLFGLELLGVLAFPFLTIAWQQYVTTYVGQEPPGLWYPIGSTLVALVVFAVIIALWRVVTALLHWMLTRVESRIVREAVARIVATALTIATVVLAVQFLNPVVMAAVERNAARVNAASPAGKVAPTSGLRSGGPGSPWSWESLGQDGATFVSSGPDAAGITAATGRPAKEPIRVFVGVGAPLTQTRDAVLAELDRTGAWDRKAILVTTATSTGFINVWGAASFECLLDGDTAIASMAYSDLPSAFGLITARQEPPESARLLLDGVRARVAAMPADKRPKIYVTGESLGAYGSDGAFSSPEQILREVDGAVWSGTPEFASNRRRLTAARQPGSTTIVPVIDNGAHIRFAGDPTQLDADEYDRKLGPWDAPRVVYLQHPSDPVVWWSPNLLFTSPEWLRETRGGTPMAQMSWTPLVTFWQVSADMLVSNNVPGGFGHRYYGPDMVPAWAQVLGITDRSPEQLERIIDTVGR